MIARAVAFNQGIRCFHFHCWSQIINHLNQLIAGCRGCISAVVRDRYRERSREAERAFAIRRNRTVGDGQFRNQATIAVVRSFNHNRTQGLNRGIHTTRCIRCEIGVGWAGQREHWSFVVYQRDGLNERAAVATVVHRRVRADVGTNWGDASRITFCVFEGDKHVSTVVGSRSIQGEVWPISTADLDALLRFEYRCRFVDH